MNSHSNKVDPSIVISKLKMQWSEEGSCLYGQYDNLELTDESKICAFDLDHTIMIPKDGKTFAKAKDDWIFVNNVPDYLIQLQTDGYKLVIITNQKGISSGKVPVEVWKAKIAMMANMLKIPFIIMAAMKDDGFRKPRTGIWDKYVKGNRSQSFYCGDSGGLAKRKLDGKWVKKDFSDSDLKFACNVGVQFKHADKLAHESFTQFMQPSTYSVKYLDTSAIERGSYTDFVSRKNEMVINVGLPGSGKSYYTTKYIEPKGYVRINRDNLGTMKKCLIAAEKSISEGKSVVIDNTNPDIKSRKLFVELAKKYGYNLRCLDFNTSRDLSMHNMWYRSIKEGVKHIPKIVYNMFRKKYTPATQSEGFDVIESVDFILELSDNDYEKYNKYYY